MSSQQHEKGRREKRKQFQCEKKRIKTRACDGRKRLNKLSRVFFQRNQHELKMYFSSYKCMLFWMMFLPLSCDCILRWLLLSRWHCLNDMMHNVIDVVLLRIIDSRWRLNMLWGPLGLLWLVIYLIMNHIAWVGDEVVVVSRGQLLLL